MRDTRYIRNNTNFQVRSLSQYQVVRCIQTTRYRHDIVLLFYHGIMYNNYYYTTWRTTTIISLVVFHLTVAATYWHDEVRKILRTHRMYTWIFSGRNTRVFFRVTFLADVRTHPLRLAWRSSEGLVEFFFPFSFFSFPSSFFFNFKEMFPSRKEIHGRMAPVVGSLLRWNV